MGEFRRFGRDRERQTLYYQRPEVKARRRDARERPENKAKKRVYDAQRRQRPDIQDKKKAYRNTPEARAKAREGLLRRQYGLTPAAYRALLAQQGGACAICEEKSWGSHGPVIDHDHATGKVRGILCSRCNVVLGRLRDDAGLAMRMASYLIFGGVE